MIKNEIVRRHSPHAPFMYSAHLIRPGNAIPGEPFAKTRDRNVTDLIGCGFQRNASKADVFGELHASDIPHNGEYRQPRIGERQRHLSSGSIPNMGNRLKALRQERGWTHEEAAEKVGVSRSQFIKLERGERRLTSDYIERVSKGFGVPAAAVISDEVESIDAVPIVGKAGAGPDGTVLFSQSDGALGYGPAAPNSNDRTQALEVEGDSMRGIASDGWLVYYDDEPLHPTQELIGELCVVGLEDERVLVKVLQPGRGEGLFDLESFNAPVMRDVAVRWACLVTSIIPRKPAIKMAKKLAKAS